MHPLDGWKLESLPLSGLQHIRDLIYYDGPVLSQYASPQGDCYLVYWCDCDDTSNRWMVLRVGEGDVVRLINRVVPLDYIIPKGSKDSFVYFVDVRGNLSIAQAYMTKVERIHDDYTPKLGAYLDPLPSMKMEKSLSIAVEGGWSPRSLTDFPGIFSKIYAFLYSLNKLKVTGFAHHPWRGGFSSFHFFREAEHRIPSEDRLGVAAMAYSSPGFMRFSLHAQTGHQVTQCTDDMKTRNQEIAGAYAELMAYIRENKLNEIQSEYDEIWKKHNGELHSKTLSLMRGFKEINEEDFVNACPRPFEAAKIAMAFYRYVKELGEFEKEGLVRFPPKSARFEESQWIPHHMPVIPAIEKAN